MNVFRIRRFGEVINLNESTFAYCIYNKQLLKVRRLFRVGSPS